MPNSTQTPTQSIRSTPDTSPVSAFGQKLIDIAQTPHGFAASEITGHAPEAVRRAAEALVRAGHLVRFKLINRRVRYFANLDIANRYQAGQRSALPVAGRAAASARSRARWCPDAPPIITPQTKIYIAPPMPRNVYRTNTYSQFR